MNESEAPDLLLEFPSNKKNKAATLLLLLAAISHRRRVVILTTGFRSPLDGSIEIGYLPT